MAEQKKKGLGNTLLGLFVVREDEGQEEGAGAEPPRSAPAAGTGDATVDDLIARYAGGGSGASRPGSRPPPLPGTTSRAGWIAR